MKRITPAVKAIADRHLEAVRTDTGWTELTEEQLKPAPGQDPREWLRELMLNGATLKSVVGVIEAKYIPIFSSVLAGALKHTSNQYRKGIYKGFKALFD